MYVFLWTERGAEIISHTKFYEVHHIIGIITSVLISRIKAALEMKTIYFLLAR